jgi:hypothetical protein
MADLYFKSLRAFALVEFCEDYDCPVVTDADNLSDENREKFGPYYIGLLSGLKWQRKFESLSRRDMAASIDDTAVLVNAAFLPDGP